MSYTCPVCGTLIDKWLLKKPGFECPECKHLLTSNSKKVSKQSLMVAFIVWLLVLVTAQHFSGSWAYAVLLSIEAGGILAAMLAALYYHFAVKVLRAKG